MNNHGQRWKDEQILAAVNEWKWSEWILDTLRTEHATPPKQPTDQELFEWYQRSQPIH